MFCKKESLISKVGGDNLILCPPLSKSLGDMSPISPPLVTPLSISVPVIRFFCKSKDFLTISRVLRDEELKYKYCQYFF